MRMTNYLVVEDLSNGKIIACCHIYACQINSQAHPMPYFMLKNAQLRLYMANLVVLDEYRRKGVASLLLDMVFTLGRSMNLV